jgi:hypothetical protein
MPPPRSLLRNLQVIALSLPQPSFTYSTWKIQPENFTTALRQYTREGGVVTATSRDTITQHI